jgi:pentatricopeptide repeat protein
VAFNDQTLLFLQRTEVNRDAIARHEFRQIWPEDWSFAGLDSPDTRVQATAEARRAFALSPDSVFAQTAMARTYMVNDQYASAAVMLRKFASDKQASANYLRDFGYALFRTGNTQEADQVFERMIHKNLLPGFAWYMRSFIASQEGRPTAARQFLSEAIKAEPANAAYREAFNGLSASVK